jgi:hypothetical protein
LRSKDDHILSPVDQPFGGSRKMSVFRTAAPAFNTSIHVNAKLP